MKSYKAIATLLAATCLLVGCVKEEPDPGPEPGSDGAVTVMMNIPTPYTMGTYAMNAKQECEIVTVDVLVFHPDGTFLYREMGTGVSDGVGDNKKYFSVKIKKTLDPDHVMAFVLANVRTTVDAALEGEGQWLTPNVTKKEEVIEKMVFDLPTDQTAATEGGKWLVLPGRYTRFPMWGQTANIDLTAPYVLIPEVTMLRAVAKIDVGLAFPTAGTQAEQDVAAGLDNFFLEEFYLYNAYDKLQVAPSTSRLSGTAVTAPSIPDGANVFGSADKPIAYARRSYNADGYKSFVGEIYLAEHVAGADNDRPNNSCIVVGGRFGTLAQAQAKSVPVTYYRIDMVKSTINDGVITAQEYLPLLRNHRYKVNITAVHARGYDTPREAFDAMGLNTNMSVVITSQDERVTEIVYDGQYMMGVDKRSVTTDKRAHPGRQIYINTDYPLGWKATSNVPWLTVTVASGVKGGSLMTYDVAANTGGLRSGTITLQAGRLFMNIQVIQSDVADIELLNLKSEYEMDGITNTFTLKCNYNWKAKVVDDEYNIVTDFMSEGTVNMAGVTYTFKLIDDISMNRLLKDQKANLLFYSPTDEFEPLMIPIRGRTPLVYGNYLLYWEDLPRGKKYAQYNGEYNVDGSCASIDAPNMNSRGWKLPSVADWTAIAAAAGGWDNIQPNGIAEQVSYLTSNTEYSNGITSMFLIRLYSSGGAIKWGNTNDAINGYPVRCMRVK